MEKEELRKKIENFWYYYKWYVIGGILLVLCTLVGIRSCNRKIDADLNVLFAADRSPNSRLVEEMGSWLSDFTEDVNGDGEKIARILTTATVDQWNGNNTASMMVQVNSGEAVLYVLTDETYAIMHEAELLQELSGESPYLEGDRYRLTESGHLDELPAFADEEETLYLCIRKVTGTNLDGSEEHLKQEELAKSVLEQLILKEK